MYSILRTASIAALMGASLIVYHGALVEYFRQPSPCSINELLARDAATLQPLLVSGPERVYALKSNQGEPK